MTEMNFMIASWSFSAGIPVPAPQESRIKAHTWYHCQRDMPGLHEWLIQNQIPAPIIESLLAEDTRPIFEQYDRDNFLLILRGVNLNKNAKAEDMLSLRMLYVNGALISTRKIPSKTLTQILERLENQTGPRNLSELVVNIIDGLNKNIDNYLSSAEEKIAEFDEQLQLSEELMQTHKALLKIKRFIKPQQYAIDDLQSSSIAMADAGELPLRHSLNTITRINETLEFYLSEIDIIKGELRQYHAEKMNRNTYLFTVIAAIFLPTSFLTGLLGVNVGGIPGTESPAAFALFCLILVVIFFAEILLLRRLRMIDKEMG